MNDIQYFTNALRFLSPELCVVAAIVLATLWNLFFPKAREFTAYISIGLLGAAIVVLTQQFQMEPVTLFQLSTGGGLFTIDKLTSAFGIIACGVGIITILMTMGYEWHFANNRGEFYAILLTAVLSVMLLAGTTDLVMLFIGLETLTICCVLLSGFAKKDRKSNEASLKYLLSTAATTATFLYGISFLYGMTGATDYASIQRKLETGLTSPNYLIIMVLVLLLSVIGFKLSMVPFHMWSPDVYEGAPTPVTAFLSVGSKLGGVVMAIRLLPVVFGGAATDWSLILGSLAILSMIMGNMIALAQSSLKRMLAYSSIAHVGYLLIGLTANTQDGLAAMVFYVIVYGFMNLGAFAGVVMFANETGSDNIDDFAGLIKKRPWLAVMLSICLLNLAGLPVPPAGFLAKVFVFWSGFQMYSSLGYFLVGTALLTSVPAIYYYTRVVVKMVVQEPSERVLALPPQRPILPDPQAALYWAMGIAIAGITVGSILVNPLMNFSTRAISDIKPSPTVGALPTSNLQ